MVFIFFSIITTNIEHNVSLVIHITPLIIIQNYLSERKQIILMDHFEVNIFIMFIIYFYIGDINFEDTKGIITPRKSKRDIHCHDQRKGENDANNG